MTAAPQTQSLTLEHLGRAELMVLVRHCIRSGALKGDASELLRAMWQVFKERADAQREVCRAASRRSQAAAHEAGKIRDAVGFQSLLYEDALSAAKAAHGKAETEWKILRRYERAAERTLAQWRREQKGQAA